MKQKTRRDQIEMEGSVRMKGHIEMTSPPSDLSSIDGNEEERTCHTPNSMASSSDDNKVLVTGNHVKLLLLSTEHDTI